MGEEENNDYGEFPRCRDPRIEQERLVIKACLRKYLKALYANRGIKNLEDLNSLVGEVPYRLEAIAFYKDIIASIFKSEKYPEWKTVEFHDSLVDRIFKKVINYEKDMEENHTSYSIPVICSQIAHEHAVYFPSILYITDLEEDFGTGFATRVVEEIKRLSDVDAFNENINHFFVMEDKEVRRDDCD